jgi:hypothetical protein
VERAIQRGAAYDFSKVGTAFGACEAALVAKPFVLAHMAEDQVPLTVHDGRLLLRCERDAVGGRVLSTAKTKIDSELCVALHMQMSCGAVRC